jgi:hypothetical protein
MVVSPTWLAGSASVPEPSVHVRLTIGEWKCIPGGALSRYLKT